MFSLIVPNICRGNTVNLKCILPNFSPENLANLQASYLTCENPVNHKVILLNILCENPASFKGSYLTFYVKNQSTLID